jgi:AraC-like DNA-binding protein
MKRVNRVSGLREPGFLEELSELTYAILMELSRSAARKRVPEEVQRAVDFMRQRVTENVTNDRIAAAACKSVSRLSALFRKHLGCSPMAYFIRLKMDHAKILLGNSGATVASVADQLGYSSQFYFARLFRKHTGSSPRQFRRDFGGGARH